jgi:ATP-binding cassette subfamily B protein
MKSTHAIAVTGMRDDLDREVEQRPLEFGLIRRILTYTRAHARKRNWLVVLVLTRSVQLPLLAWTIGAVINGPITHRDPEGTLWGALGFLALGLFTQFVLHFRQRFGLELGEAVVHDLRRDIFDHLQRMPLSFFNRMKTGRLISRVTSDAESVRAGVQDVLFVGLVNAGQMIVAAVLMVWYDWVMFLVVAGMAPVIWTYNRYFRRKLSRIVREAQESMSRVTANLAESVSGIRVTQGFVRQEINAGFFRELVKVHGDYNFGVARANAVFLPLLELNSQFFLAALIVLGGYRVLQPDGGMQVGDLIQFFFLANLFFSPIQAIGTLYNQALTAMAGAERVFRLLDTKPEWTDAPDAIELPPIRGRVEFRNVTFRYGADRPALEEISFVAEPGQTVALVGHTGSGKSSMINLIAKFYLPSSGQVLVDALDILKLTSESLHRQMGIVAQQNFLFSGTVIDNIRVGKPAATDEQVIEAARRLDVLDLFGAMSEGLRTPVGERGSGLSLGQRQLVCFTRAMLADPRILILDEATSSVDAMTEARLQLALAKLLKGRTSFVVAHRLSTIRHADLVLVLERGRIIERGTHNALLAAGGVYANLYRQFIRATES